MKILSIHNLTHDTSVALIENGKITYAASNERFSRIKTDRSFPTLALKNCLEYTKVKIKDIDEVVLVGDPFPDDLFKSLQINILNTLLDIRFVLAYGGFNFIKSLFTRPVFILESFSFLGIPNYLYRSVGGRLKIRELLKGFKGKYTYVHHHLAHLYSAYYTSGWKKCLAVCIEGAGFNETASIYKVENDKWEKITEVSLPHSIGYFYHIPTLLLGFKLNRHEGKITGLSAYGNPGVIYKHVKKILRAEGNSVKFDFISMHGWFINYYLNKKTPEFFNGVKREDVAAAFQKRLEECVLELIENAVKKTKIGLIAFAGGVAANVKLNQKIHEIKGVSGVHIHQAMDDSGIALGAVLHIAHLRGFDVPPPQQVYFGPDFTIREIEKTIKKYRVPYKKYQGIEKKIAKLLSESRVVARFNGRMEYGPRALGNRSVLYQGIDPSVNDWLNKQLKRSEFMPFAPVTLDKYADKCYLNLRGAEYPARFMTITFNCTDYMKSKTPAAVHVDGTARPQIIRKQDNLSYYRILEEYHKITGIPSLVNTSFNMHEEPIVCTPDDALRSFLAGGLDYLAIGPFLVSVKFPV